MAGKAVLCSRCGAPVGSPSQPRQAPAPVARTGIRARGAPLGHAHADSGNAVLKIIVWVLALSTLVALFSIASCAYFDYRARKKTLRVPQTPHYARKDAGTASLKLDARAACSLVSNEEVGQALGTVVSSTSSGASRCRYTSSVGRSLTVDVTPQAGSFALQLSAMTMRKTQGAAGVVRPVVGIGDEAYVGHLGSTLIFRKGSTVVNLEVHTDGHPFLAARVIAQKIATRLP